MLFRSKQIAAVKDGCGRAADNAQKVKTCLLYTSVFGVIRIHGQPRGAVRIACRVCRLHTVIKLPHERVTVEQILFRVIDRLSRIEMCIRDRCMEGYGKAQYSQALPVFLICAMQLHRSTSEWYPCLLYTSRSVRPSGWTKTHTPPPAPWAKTTQAASALEPR